MVVELKNDSFLKNGGTLFFAVFLSVFFKCILFHLFCFGSMPVGSIMSRPLHFFCFYFNKLLPSIIVASFAFIVRRKWWIIPVSIIVDLWLVANLLYFRSYGAFMDVEVIKMAGELDGATSSILPYINWKTFSFIIISLFLYLSLPFIERSIMRNWKSFLICWIICLFMGTFNCLFGYNKRNNGAEFGWDYNCYERATVVISQDNNCVCTLASSQWVEQQTPLHYFPAFCYMKIGQMVSLKQASIELSSEEIRDIGQFLQKGDSTDCVKRKDNLIFILGESFESWCLEMTDETGRCLLPNLKRISQGDNCLYCSKIRCQTRAGNSGDGQMIVNTGLLPLTSSESACMKFANNVFPNFAHFYEHSAIINPWPGIWNQNKITKSYGYTDLIEKNENVNKDEIAFDMAYDYLKQNFGSCCVFVITVSTHTPFNSVENKDVLEFSDDMPKQLKDYLSCFHYTDSCIGSFCDKIENDSLLKNTIIVMTGDHTFFKEPLLKEFQKYSKKNNAPIPEKESFCPLLVLSPSIDKHIEQNEVCYQMDVFPTVLDCIGVDNYYWKGFGVSLLDSVAVSNRTITEDKAFVISNKIIRSNYLKEVEKSF